MWEILVVLSNVACAAVLYRQHMRHTKYREEIHALLADEGRAEGEAAAIIEETLRLTAHLKLPEPSARDFAHALIQQGSFRKAVAHDALHDVYVETQGRRV